MRVTPTLVQAAEAVLRGALDAALAGRDEGVQALLAKQVCPCRGDLNLRSTYNNI